MLTDFRLSKSNYVLLILANIFCLFILYGAVTRFGHDLMKMIGMLIGVSSFSGMVSYIVWLIRRRKKNAGSFIFKIALVYSCVYFFNYTMYKTTDQQNEQEKFAVLQQNFKIDYAETLANWNIANERMSFDYLNSYVIDGADSTFTLYRDEIKEMISYTSKAQIGFKEPIKVIDHYMATLGKDSEFYKGFAEGYMNEHGKLGSLYLSLSNLHLEYWNNTFNALHYLHDHKDVWKVENGVLVYTVPKFQYNYENIVNNLSNYKDQMDSIMVSQ